MIFCSLIDGEKRSKQEEDEIVENYFKKFNKRSKSLKEFEKRKQNVLKRFYAVEDHNEKFKQGLELYEQELNELSELDDEEVNQKWTGVKIPSDVGNSFNNSLPPLPGNSRRRRSTVPSNWNWAGTSVVQPVQNQGPCGSCYVRSATKLREFNEI